VASLALPWFAPPEILSPKVATFKGGRSLDDFAINGTVAVPEPSTYAMALAGLACGGYSMFRRRKRV
jgi:hypothetical protein